MKESKGRSEYRARCKHRGMYDKCYEMSGFYGAVHMSFACTPDADCARMRRYDKLNHNDNERL